MLKDKLLLYAINPKNGIMRAQNTMSYLLLCASFYDLVLMEKLSVNSDRIAVIAGPTGDPVLDRVLEKLSGLQGKKISGVLNKLSFTAGKIYKSQIKYLENTHMITSKPMTWLGITWGKLYRVNRAENLKPIQNIFERALIYGRKTNTENRLLIELLGYSNIMDSYFPAHEYKQVAKKRLHALSALKYDQYHESIFSIRKQLINHLKASKAMKG